MALKVTYSGPSRNPRHTVRRFDHRLGMVIAALGLAAAMAVDVAAAWAIINHQLMEGLLTHAAATLLWLAARQRLDGAASSRASLTRLFGSEAGTEWCIALCLFPVLGMFSQSIALLTNGLFAPPIRAEDAATSGDEPMSDILEMVHHELLQPFDPNAEAALLPLAIRIARANSSEKRAAIDLICRCPHPHGMELVRLLLEDPDPDIRALAALAIDRLGHERTQEMMDS